MRLFVAIDTNKRIIRLPLFDRRSFGNDIVYKNELATASVVCGGEQHPVTRYARYS